MTHLILTSALLFALLAVVAVAIGASLGIAHDWRLDEAREGPADMQSSTAGEAVHPHYAARPGRAVRQDRDVRQDHDLGHGLAEDFGLGLQHATQFAQGSGRSFNRSRSFNTRI